MSVLQWNTSKGRKGNGQRLITHLTSVNAGHFKWSSMNLEICILWLKLSIYYTTLWILTISVLNLTTHFYQISTIKKKTEKGWSLK
jgi:hypothetical protein